MCGEYDKLFKNYELTVYFRVIFRLIERAYDHRNLVCVFEQTPRENKQKFVSFSFVRNMMTMILMQCVNK